MRVAGEAIALSLGSSPAPRCELMTLHHTMRTLALWSRSGRAFVHGEAFHAPSLVTALYEVEPGAHLRRVWRGEGCVVGVFESGAHAEPVALVWSSCGLTAYTMAGEGLGSHPAAGDSIDVLSTTRSRILIDDEGNGRFELLDADLRVLARLPYDGRLPRRTRPEAGRHRICLLGDGSSVVLFGRESQRAMAGLHRIPMGPGAAPRSYYRGERVALDVQDAGAGRIVCSWDDGATSMFDARDLDLLWECRSCKEEDTVRQVLALPALGVVVLWYVSGVLEARGADSGRQLWCRWHNPGPAARPLPCGEGKLASFGHALALPLCDPAIGVYSLEDGSLRYWISGLGGRISHMVGVEGTTLLLAADCDGRITCWDCPCP